MGRKLYVGNLSYKITESELRDIFAESGDVTDVKVVLDRETGRPRGFAFVEMASDADAGKAIENLNGREVMGRTMNVSEARERERGGGGGGGGGGFRRGPGGGGGGDRGMDRGMDRGGGGGDRGGGGRGRDRDRGNRDW
ncbi:MAG: RNA-binding protein [Deltaproteobacteria bacterium]|nr:RNA-binding protein [Deltaproteobacteria bacterium]